MRILLGFLCSLLIFFCPASQAKDCESGATVQGEVISCMYETYFDPLDKQVNSEYNKLLYDLRQSPDISTNPDALQEAQTHLTDAQMAWEKYRDSTCEFVWNQRGGQTVNWGDKYGCLMDFDQARLKTLQRYRRELWQAD